jgi:hypothetical protein
MKVIVIKVKIHTGALKKLGVPAELLDPINAWVDSKEQPAKKAVIKKKKTTS